MLVRCGLAQANLNVNTISQSQKFKVKDTLALDHVATYTCPTTPHPVHPTLSLNKHLPPSPHSDLYPSYELVPDSSQPQLTRINSSLDQRKKSLWHFLHIRLANCCTQLPSPVVLNEFTFSQQASSPAHALMVTSCCKCPQSDAAPGSSIMRSQRQTVPQVI